MKRIQKQIYQYTAVFEPDREVGGYTVTIPALPGCISEGDTFEEAVKNIHEAAALYVGVSKKKPVKKMHREIIFAPVELAF